MTRSQAILGLIAALGITAFLVALWYLGSLVRTAREYLEYLCDYHVKLAQWELQLNEREHDWKWPSRETTKAGLPGGEGDVHAVGVVLLKDGRTLRNLPTGHLERHQRGQDQGEASETARMEATTQEIPNVE